MVKGITKFKEYFADFSGEYVFIGGTACDLLLNRKEIEFRVTKDLDIVLIMEAVDKEFVKKFIDFITDGKYLHIKKGTGENQFYRFESPEDESFPAMIELFSKRPDYLEGLDQNLGPIHIDEDVISLSAILLNDEYYDLLKEGMVDIDGMTVLDLAYLIVFKIKAWIDLTERKNLGERIDSRSIKKHRKDIVRLVSVLENDMRLSVSEEIRNDIEQFMKDTELLPIDMKALGLKGVSYAGILKRIGKCYGI